MPGPKMGPRPLDFDETIIRQSPTFLKWASLTTGQKLRYACRDFVKGRGDDEERLMRRIMIARRNNIRDHEILKTARSRTRATTTTIVVATTATINTITTVKQPNELAVYDDHTIHQPNPNVMGMGPLEHWMGVVDGSPNEDHVPSTTVAAAAIATGTSTTIEYDETKQPSQPPPPTRDPPPPPLSIPLPPPLLPPTDDATTVTTTGASATHSSLDQPDDPSCCCEDSKNHDGTTTNNNNNRSAKRPRHSVRPSTDEQVEKEMDILAVEATRSYKSWMALPPGKVFVYNQRYIKGKEGHDWLLRKNIWRRMRYRRENKKMLERLNLTRQAGGSGGRISLPPWRVLPVNPPPAPTYDSNDNDDERHEQSQNYHHQLLSTEQQHQQQQQQQQEHDMSCPLMDPTFLAQYATSADETTNHMVVDAATAAAAAALTADLMTAEQEEAIQAAVAAAESFEKTAASMESNHDHTAAVSMTLAMAADETPTALPAPDFTRMDTVAVRGPVEPFVVEPVTEEESIVVVSNPNAGSHEEYCEPPENLFTSVTEGLDVRTAYV